MEQYYYEYDTVIGRIRLVEEKNALVALSLAGKEHPDAFRRKGEKTYGELEEELIRAGARCQETALISEAHEQLEEYFAGNRREFTIPLCPRGTDFQQRVWAALVEIPYGETRTYGEIASRIGSPKACRAVGTANHGNPIAILIPCHRVIGADGSLTGYGGGLDIKEILLKTEGILC